MAIFQALRGWTPAAKHTVMAGYLAWTLDAYDFFLLTLVFKDIAAQFGTSITAIAVATMLTLACRPLGAFIFGHLADRYGRRPILMLNITLYSLLNLLVAFTWDIRSFYIVSASFGIAMGGVWGICASLSMETVKVKARGFVSGLLQAGYPSGFLISALVFGYLYPVIGWRGMFMVGVIPAALLIFYIYALVPESQHFDPNPAKNKKSTMSILRENGRIALFAILLMTAFNFLSHGTQDLYTTFLRIQHGLDPATVKNVLVVSNIGAIAGGLFFGSLSQKCGRRRTIILVTLLALPITYVWSHSLTPVSLAAGAFLMQVCVQGAWGVVPAHLNELAPAGVRGIFAGTCYQLGNLIAAVNNPLQSSIAAHANGNYGLALMAIAACAALMIAVLTWLGPEAQNVAMGAKVAETSE